MPNYTGICPHDGGKCHHNCLGRRCFRERGDMRFDTPREGYPLPGHETKLYKIVHEGAEFVVAEISKAHAVEAYERSNGRVDVLDDFEIEEITGSISLDYTADAGHIDLSPEKIVPGFPKGVSPQLKILIPKDVRYGFAHGVIWASEI